MENSETLHPRIFTDEDAEQFCVSIAIVLNPLSRTLFGDEWYEGHLEIVRQLLRDYPRETSAILRYISQCMGTKLKIRR